MIEHFDIDEGKIWAVDKPLGWSSFHVVKKLRGALLSRVRAAGIRKLKVGHAGTLDPLASGVMLICVGRKTKEIDRLQSGVKEYEAELQLGSTTPSFDLETPIDHTYPTEHISRELIDAVIPKFIGRIEQVPPAYSAVKVDGHRAYKMARTGQEVELKPKTLIIDSIEVLQFDESNMKLTLRIKCSKGTYIRALARDIGIALDSGAHLTGLRRTRVGEYFIENSQSIDDAVRQIYQSEISAKVDQEDIVIPPVEYTCKTSEGNIDKRDILPYSER